MVLNIFALLLVLGITFVNSLFGLFSGIINVFCCIAALLVSFGFGEALNSVLTGSASMPPSYAEPIAYVGLYFLTFILLRVAADNLIRGNVRVPMYADWGGGAVAGFIIGQVTVGVAVLGFLMLPWGDRVAGFARLERDAEETVNPDTGRVEFRRNDLWLRSDQFAVGLFNVIAGGSLRGGTTFASVYPDFPEWVFWSGNQIQHQVQTSPSRGKDGDGFRDGLRVERWWTLSGRGEQQLDQSFTAYRRSRPGRQHVKSERGLEWKENLPPLADMTYRVQDGGHLLGVRVTLNPSSADREKDGARHRFRPTMIRLVGDIVQPDGTREPRHYCAQVMGGADPVFGDKLRIVDPDNNFSMAETTATIDVYFEVEEGFQPRFIEYRRHARAAIVGAPDTPPDDRLVAGGPPVSTGRGGKGSGVARFIDSLLDDQSGPRAELPFPIAAGRLGGSAEARDGRLARIEAGSRVSGFRDELMSEAPGSITQFLAPSGQRIFQTAFYTRKMESLPGQVMNYVGSVTNVYSAVDRSGAQYFLAGYYAIVKREGRDYIEMFFTPDPGEVGYQSRVELSQDVRQALRNQPDAILGLIFVVPDGACLTRLEVGGGKFEFDKDWCVNP